MMKKIQLLKTLERYQLFTENDIAKLTNKNADYVRKLLYRLNKENLIKRIEKGKYTIYDDAMVFASYLAMPSYFSLWTALKYYGMIQQQPYALFVMSQAPKKQLKFQNTQIIFKKTSHIFGYRKERYSNLDIFMAEPEKAIIDSLMFKLPIKDIKDGLENQSLNLEKLAYYANKTKNISLIKRLGFMLEKIKGNSYGMCALDGNYILFDYLGKKRGKKDSKWKLIVNAEI